MRLYAAAAQGDLEEVVRRLDGRARIWRRLFPEGVNVPHSSGVCPIHAAAEGGFWDVVDALVARGGDIDVRTSSGQYTPLMRAAGLGQCSTVEQLLVRGADLEASDGWGRTALFHAVEFGQPEAAELLCERGASTDAKDGKGMTPLHVALSRPGSLEDAKHLESDKLWASAELAPADYREKVGETNPLYRVPNSSFGRMVVLRQRRDAKHVRTQVVHSLLRRGAQVNAQTADGQTPLYLALAAGDTKLAELLIERGAQVNVRNADGRTALHRFVLGGDLKALRFLLEHGADPSIRDYGYGLTARDLVLHRPDVEDLLLTWELGPAREAGGAGPHHYIIRCRHPAPIGDPSLVDAILRANGYVCRAATVDIATSSSPDEAYITALAMDYEASGHPVDWDKSRLHDFSGTSDGTMIAIFHKVQQAP